MMLRTCLKHLMSAYPWTQVNKNVIDLREAIKILARIGIEVELDPVLDDLFMVKVLCLAVLQKDPRAFYVQDRRYIPSSSRTRLPITI